MYEYEYTHHRWSVCLVSFVCCKHLLFPRLLSCLLTLVKGTTLCISSFCIVRTTKPRFRSQMSPRVCPFSYVVIGGALLLVVLDAQDTAALADARRPAAAAGHRRRCRRPKFEGADAVAVVRSPQWCSELVAPTLAELVRCCESAWNVVARCRVGSQLRGA